LPFHDCGGGLTALAGPPKTAKKDSNGNNAQFGFVEIVCEIVGDETQFFLDHIYERGLIRDVVLSKMERNRMKLAFYTSVRD
jgi:hypothetical protein